MSTVSVNATLEQLLDRQFYHVKSRQAEPAICVGCGCTDERACIDEQGYACHWLKVNRETGLGVCSCCLGFLSHPCTSDNE